jgi:hypothetical protein
MDKDKIKDIRYAAYRFLDWEDIYPNFYQRLEKELEDSGLGISGRYDYNDETWERDPDPEKLELGIKIDGQDGRAYDVQWSNDAYFGFEAIAEEPDEDLWDNSTHHIGNADVDAHIDELVKLLKEAENMIENHYNRYGPT